VPCAERYAAGVAEYRSSEIRPCREAVD